MRVSEDDIVSAEVAILADIRDVISETKEELRQIKDELTQIKYEVRTLVDKT